MVAFVQAASNTAAASSVTVTLGSNTTAGNCLVVCIGLGNGSSHATVSSVTLGGSSTGWSQLQAVGDLTTGAEQLAVWAFPNCTGGQTSIVVTLSGAAVTLAWAFEFSGVVTSSPLDQSATFDSGAGTNSTFSVTSGTTTVANEVAVGCVYGFNTTITGPSSPWVNESTITSTTRTLQASYNILSSTGTVTYSGSFGAAEFNGQILVTLKGTAAAAASGQLQPLGTVLVPRRRLARAVVQHITGLPPPAAPNREPPLIPQPRPPRRAVILSITGRPPPAAPNKEPPPGPRPRPPRRAIVLHVTGSFPPAVTFGRANREPFQPSRARRPQRAVTRSITGTPPPVITAVYRPPPPQRPASRRPSRAVVLSVQPRPRPVPAAGRLATADYDGKSWWKKRWILRL